MMSEDGNGKKTQSHEKEKDLREEAAEPPKVEKLVDQKTTTPAKPKTARPVAKRIPKGPTYKDLEQDSILVKLKEKFQERIISGQSFLNQVVYTVAVDCLYEALVYLRDDPECDFDYLVDVTALDFLDDEKRFMIVYHLYSHDSKKLIRLKVPVEEGKVVPSVTSIWKTADWLEREIFDLFGIEFSGHPDMKRILLPDDWQGYPLRKDYDIKLQDQAWIKEHLRITKTPF